MRPLSLLTLLLLFIGPFSAFAGEVPFTSAQTIDSYFDGVFSVFAADVDGDGDVDALGAAFSGDELTWWENLDGLATHWVKHTVITAIGGGASVHPADVDGDGGVDILWTGYYANLCAWHENQGGQFALPTTDAVISATPAEGTGDVLVLQIDAVHRGRSGDGDLELLTFELLFEEGPGDALSAAELDAVADAVRIYHDDGNGQFDVDGSDINFHTSGSPFSMISGVLTASFIDGEADVQVAQGTVNTYFVAVDLADTAGGTTPNTFLVTHLTQSCSSAEMSSTHQLSSRGTRRVGRWWVFRDSGDVVIAALCRGARIAKSTTDGCYSRSAAGSW